MSLSKPEKQRLDRKTLEQDTFTRAIRYYRSSGCSLEEVFQKIEEKYLVGQYFRDCIEHVYYN